MLIKNNSARLWMVHGVMVIPGADAVEVAQATEADIAGNEDLEIVTPKAKPGPKAKTEVVGE